MKQLFISIISVLLICIITFSSVGMILSVDAKESEVEVPQVLEYKRDAMMQNHCRRLYKAEDEFTLVYENYDNTNTYYFFEFPVKYKKNGVLYDKSSKLSFYDNQFIAFDNDIQVSIPSNNESYAEITYNEVNVGIIDCFGKSNGELIDEDSVIYKSVMTNGADYSISSLLYGAVFGTTINNIEEINDFCFIINIENGAIDDKDGNIIIYNAAGDESIRISDLYIYNEKSGANMFSGSINLISDNQYMLCYNIPEDFEEEEDDPLYTVSFTATQVVETSSNIEYLAAYSLGSTTSNLNGTAANFYIGYGSTKGFGRVLYRFPVLSNYFAYLVDHMISCQLVQCISSSSDTSLVKSYGGSWSGSSTYSTINWYNYAPSGCTPFTAYTVDGPMYAANTSAYEMSVELLTAVQRWKDDNDLLSLSSGIMMINTIGEYIMNARNYTVYAFSCMANPYVATFPPYLKMTLNKYKIMLDAGHKIDYNHSPFNNDWDEGTINWNLHIKLKAELEERGFIVGQTRTNPNENPNVLSRGDMANNYDMFLSLHVNSYGDSSWNDVRVYYDVLNHNNASDFASLMSNTVKDTMNADGITRVGTAYTLTREYPTNPNLNYYGVLRAAADTNCPLYYIIEHSYYTNQLCIEWLAVDDNLQALAEAEADTINDFYFG